MLLVLLFILLFGGVIVWAAVSFRRRVAWFEQQAKRRAEVESSPYTKADYQLFVDAGMTAEQIEQAIRNTNRNYGERR